MSGRYLVVDGGPQLDEGEAIGDHGQHTEDGGEQDGEPHVGLVQGVPGRACGKGHHLNSISHRLTSPRIIISTLPDRSCVIVI